MTGHRRPCRPTGPGWLCGLVVLASCHGDGDPALATVDRYLAALRSADPARVEALLGRVEAYRFRVLVEKLGRERVGTELRRLLPESPGRRKVEVLEWAQIDLDQCRLHVREATEAGDLTQAWYTVRREGTEWRIVDQELFRYEPRLFAQRVAEAGVDGEPVLTLKSRPGITP